MHITDEEILRIFRDCNFTDLHEYNWYQQVFDNIRLPEGFEEKFGRIWSAEGATKVVIGFRYWDWVIKIPLRAFAGSECDEEYDEENDEYNYEYEVCHWFEDADNSHNEWDYCLREVEVYEMARLTGVDHFFAEIRKINDCFIAPIYIQRRVPEKSDYYRQVRQKSPDHLYEYVFSEDEEETISSVTNKYRASESIEAAILAEVIKEEGLDQVIKLMAYLDSQDVGDLHSGNIGRKNDRMMMFDYSGYREDY